MKPQSALSIVFAAMVLTISGTAVTVLSQIDKELEAEGPKPPQTLTNVA